MEIRANLSPFFVSILSQSNAKILVSLQTQTLKNKLKLTFHAYGLNSTYCRIGLGDAGYKPILINSQLSAILERVLGPLPVRMKEASFW